MWESDREPWKANLPIRWSPESGGKVTIERLGQKEKHPSPRSSTEDGIEIVESKAQAKTARLKLARGDSHSKSENRKIVAILEAIPRKDGNRRRNAK
jgi:hypothetical protein